MNISWEKTLSTLQCNQSRERISLFVSDMYGGGAQRVMVTLANEFVNLGTEVDLVVANFEGPYCKHVNSDVRVIDLRVSRVLKSLPKLVQYIRREKPEVLLSTLMHANVVAALAHWLSGSHSRFLVREATSISAYAQERQSIKERIILRLSAYAYRYADHVIAISEGAARDIVSLLKIDRNKVSCIYNPAFNKRIDGVEYKNDNRMRGEIKILAAGRLCPEKDFSTLLRAFAQVRESKKATLTILGEGVERSTLDRLAGNLGVRDKLSLPGFVDEPFRYMSSSDVFVLSSQREGFGNVLVEAMACGTPVVSTDCPSGPAEILEDGKWGHLVPTSNHEALSKAIINTIEEPPATQTELVERAKDFASERIASQYLELLREGSTTDD